MNTEFIRHLDLISQPLTTIFNFSLRKGVFPNLENGESNAFFKLRPRSKANNYRLISAIYAVTKDLERIVHNQIYEYLKATKALKVSQSDFQKYCSPITSMIELV